MLAEKHDITRTYGLNQVIIAVKLGDPDSSLLWLRFDIFIYKP